ncbi:MAG TPA: type II toxin-antitoxin system RelE/ParE family toxin [Thermomicrobiales bacterium]|jgi:toxin ParE1/3/4
MSARRRRLVLAPDARRDLSEILVYTEQQWGKQQRIKCQAMIDQALRHLAMYPNLGRGRDEISPGLRSYPVGSHVVYYRVSEHELIVNRIVHGRRDITETGIVP